MSNVDRPSSGKDLGQAAREAKAPPFKGRESVDKGQAVEGVDLQSVLDRLEAPALKDRETRKVQVVGRVRDGKIELDQASLTDFSRKFPDAGMVFIAVNAPFDPVSAASDAGQQSSDRSSAVSV